MLKKLVCSLCVSCMFFSLTACGNDTSSESTIQAETVIEEAEVSSEELVEDSTETAILIEYEENDNYALDGKLSIQMYDSKHADMHYLIDRTIKAGFELDFDNTNYVVIYGDIGNGLSANILDITNGNTLGELSYQLTDEELVINLDLSDIPGISLDSITSFSVGIDYDGEGREFVCYNSKDVVTKADSTSAASNDDQDTNSTSSDSSDKKEANEKDVDISILANYAGKYKDNSGNSFTISKDMGYGIREVKLYSLAGWPEEIDNDGVRFYDTPTVDSVKQGEDYIIVKTVSQYILAEGTFKFYSDGSVEVTYRGGTLSSEFSGTFHK